MSKTSIRPAAFSRHTGATHRRTRGRCRPRWRNCRREARRSCRAPRRDRAVPGREDEWRATEALRVAVEDNASRGRRRCPARGGAVTVSACGAPAPSYSVETPVPLSLSQNGLPALSRFPRGSRIRIQVRGEPRNIGGEVGLTTGSAVAVVAMASNATADAICRCRAGDPPRATVIVIDMRRPDPAMLRRGRHPRVPGDRLRSAPRKHRVTHALTKCSFGYGAVTVVPADTGRGPLAHASAWSAPPYGDTVLACHASAPMRSRLCASRSCSATRLDAVLEAVVDAPRIGGNSQLLDPRPSGCPCESASLMLLRGAAPACRGDGHDRCATGDPRSTRRRMPAIQRP